MQALCACALCKLLCASCSAQVALRKCLCASCSAQVLLLWECTSRTIFVLKSCDFPAGVWILKVAIFQPELQEHAPRTTFVLKSCDFQAGAAADQGGIEPATAGLRKQARKPFREQQFARRHSESASTRTISAESSLRLRRIRTAPQRERFDTHDLRRGFIWECQKCKKTRVFAPRPRRSPQWVARAYQTTKKNLEFLHLPKFLYCSWRQKCLLHEVLGIAWLLSRNFRPPALLKYTW